MNLKFLGYIVNEMHFRLNGEAQAPGLKNFTINPNIHMDIKKAPKNLVLTITVKIEGSPEKPTPFDITVVLTGNFEIITECDVDSMRIEASQVLYPYARTVLSQLTGNANMPSYFLPTIDFSRATPIAGDRKNGVIIRPSEDTFLD